MSSAVSSPARRTVWSGGGAVPDAGGSVSLSGGTWPATGPSLPSDGRTLPPSGRTRSPAGRTAHAERPALQAGRDAVSQREGLARWIAGTGRPGPRFARLVAVTGGKGGVGKSNVSLNFSLALAARGDRVLLVDCDTGLGNIDVLLGLCPPLHLGHVLEGECDIEEAIVPIPGAPRVDILPAASGLVALGAATAREADRMMRAVAALEPRHDIVVLDTGAGLGSQVRALLRAAPEILVVTTPEPTALADAYATLKVVRAGNPYARVCLLVNMADGSGEAEQAVAGVVSVADRYLGWHPEYIGHLPRDASVPLAVRNQQPFLVCAPSSPAARALQRATARWLGEPDAAPPGGGLGAVLRSFWKARVSAGG